MLNVKVMLIMASMLNINVNRVAWCMLSLVSCNEYIVRDWCVQLGTAVCSPFCALGWGKFPFCPCPLVHLRFPCHVVGFHFYLSAILPFITLLIFTCCGHWCLTLRLNGLQWYMLMVMQLHTFVLVCYVTVHTWNVKRHTSHFSALGKQHLHTPSWPTLLVT